MIDREHLKNLAEQVLKPCKCSCDIGCECRPFEEFRKAVNPQVILDLLTEMRTLEGVSPGRKIRRYPCADYILIYRTYNDVLRPALGYHSTVKIFFSEEDLQNEWNSGRLKQYQFIDHLEFDFNTWNIGPLHKNMIPAVLINNRLEVIVPTIKTITKEVLVL